MEKMDLANQVDGTEKYQNENNMGRESAKCQDKQVPYFNCSEHNDSNDKSKFNEFYLQTKDHEKFYMNYLQR